MPAKRFKAKTINESRVNTRIRYTSYAPESKHHYRIRSENAHSLYQLSAWKQISHRIQMNPGWKCEFAVPATLLKANITIESMVKTRILYTSQALGSKYHYRNRGEHVSSLYQVRAWNRISLSSPRWKREFATPAKRLKVNTTIESQVKMRIRYTS